MENLDKPLVIGKITGAFGIKGWVKIHSYTAPEENLFRYSPLYLRKQKQYVPVTVEQFQAHGKGYIAKFVEIPDRNAAELLHHVEFIIDESQLIREDSDNDIFWHELINVVVYNQAGIKLGVVTGLFNTGSNDILVVKGEREHLIPYLPYQVIIEVDKSKKQMIVDWDENF